MRTSDQIKQEIEDYLLSGSVFEYILRSNPNLYNDKLNLLSTSIISPDTLNVDKIKIEYEAENIKLIGDPIIIRFEELSIKHFGYEALYISDFEFNGHIYISEPDQLELKIKATLRIFTGSTQIPEYNGLVEVPKIFSVLDKNAYTVWAPLDKQKEIQNIENLLHIKI